MNLVGALQLQVNFATENFEKYVHFLEEKFDTSMFQIGKRYKKIDNEELDEEYYDYLQNSLIEEYTDTKSFIHRFRNAVVIQLYTLVETCLVDYAMRKIDNFQHNDGNIIDIYKENDILKSSVDITKLKEYQKIQSLEVLRNLIVHHNGEFSQCKFEKNTNNTNRLLDLKKRKGLEIKAQEHLSSTEYHILITDTKYLFDSINAVNSFLQTIIGKLLSKD